jgi:hypothetical protein
MITNKQARDFNAPIYGEVSQELEDRLFDSWVNSTWVVGLTIIPTKSTVECISDRRLLQIRSRGLVGERFHFSP